MPSAVTGVREQQTSQRLVGPHQHVSAGRGDSARLVVPEERLLVAPLERPLGGPHRIDTERLHFGANETAVGVADVTDRDNPVTLSTADYPAVAYTHQGWLTEDHRYFYQNDELDEMSSVNAAQEAGTEPDMEASRTLIWDVSDLDDPILVKEHFGETFTIDHNLYIREGGPGSPSPSVRCPESL